MVWKDIIMVNAKELKRLHIIRKAMGHEMTQAEAGEILGLSSRQVRRIIREVGFKGDAGIIHKSRGQPSNRAISLRIKEKALKRFRDRYYDFGSTLASEKLLEIDRIDVNDETLRLWLIEGNIPYNKRKKRVIGQLSVVAAGFSLRKPAKQQRKLKLAATISTKN